MIAMRATVYAAIDGEREYQESKWPEAGDSGRHNVTEWLVYIEDYVAEAKRVLSRQPDPIATEFALHALRKIAGMSVAAMEQNGVRTRTQEGPRPVGHVGT